MLKKNSKIKQNIRINMRIMRKSLTITEKKYASIKISQIALNCGFIHNSKNIALFLPFDGEINTYPLILKLWSHKKKVFLPVIHSFTKKEMLFVHFSSNSTLYYNKYKILEPFFNCKDIISTSNLDLIIVPLVAFDNRGSRLGMGGGFYDIFLTKWKEKKIIPVGLSYDFQFVDNLPTQSWDISLPIILTPNKIWVF